MELKNNLMVISLTHWDREWRFPFQKTRMLLVEMIDGLLETLEKDPDYRCFHLDGQTILLEDYCEVRPEKADVLRRHIESGRLLIGPWFVLPEENQMSGESLVRNFLWGERLGRRFGGNMKVGYSPTSWGQVSQMPQIMNGFGVESIMFYRGISVDQVPGHFYLWEGPDGSRLFGVRLGDYARASFFHLVDRPVVFGRGRADQSHDWALGGKPFRVCGSGSVTTYHFFQPPSGWHPERIEDAFRELEEIDLGVWETPFAPAMECDDSTGPFVLTPRIIEEANARITNGKEVVHGSLPEFIRTSREALDESKLPVLKGEMRHPQRAGVWTDLYAEVQAERTPMKYLNRRAEIALERVAEPLATIAWTLGVEYPQAHLDRAYKLLLQCHAHDSIGGCGVDAVHDEVEFRLRQVEIIAAQLAEDAARQIAGRIDTGGFPKDDILLVALNPLPRPASEVVVGEIDIAKSLGVKGFKVVDLDGNEVPVQILDRADSLATFNHPHELPLRTASDRWTFLFRADGLPATGHRVFRVVKALGELRHPGTLRTGPVSMKNDHLEVRINRDGTADVTVLADGRVLRGQNAFEDRGDVGDYWVGAFPMRDRIVSSLGSSARLSVIEDGPLSTAIEARIELDLPVRATQDIGGREPETRPVVIKTIYRLVMGEPFLRISTTVENTVEDHILRALFPTGVATDVASAEVAFDVIDRAIPLPDTRDWREPYRPVQPQQGFVDLSDGKRGVALLNRGIPQYEAVDDPARTVALTLMRAHRSWNSIRLAHYPDQNGTQLQGTHTFEYALMPHEGDWKSAGVHRQAERFNVRPLVGAAGPGAGEGLSMVESFLELEGEGLVLSAFKQGEWDESLVARVFNPTAEGITGALRLRTAVARAEEVNMMESEALRELKAVDGRIALDVPAKKVVTVRVALK